MGMKKITGFFYDRQKSFGFGMGAVWVFTGLLCLGVICTKIDNISVSITTIAVTLIAVFVAIIVLTAFALYYYSNDLTMIFIVDNHNLEIDIYRSDRITNTINAKDFRFSIITAPSVYSHYIRILLELEVTTDNGRLVFVEKLPSDQNPGLPIKSGWGWYMENFFAKESGALLELYKLIGNKGQ
jgi:hypothetical protein